MLTQYLTLTQNLLQAPGAPVSLYPTALLTSYINIARGQIAGEGQCVRRIGVVTTTIGVREYLFSGIVFIGLQTAPVGGVINVRRIMYAVGTGQKWIKGKSWPWFDFQRYNTPVPASGPPTEWAQYSQGAEGIGGASAQSSGSFFIDPLPDAAYTLFCDCGCYPNSLAADGDTEALPYYWTDAVPYYAAYMALLGAQTSTRIQQAQQLYALYEQFMQRARTFANPDLNNFAFEQSRIR